MNKKGFLLRDFMVALVISFSVLVILSLVVTDLAGDYGREDILDENFRTTYDRLEGIRANVTIIKTSALSEEGLSLWSTGVAIFKSVVGIIRLVVETPIFLTQTIASMGEDYGVPRSLTTIVITLIMSITLIILIFIGISSINRGNKI